MPRNEKHNEEMESNRGEIVLYQSEDGQTLLDVHLKDESVWLSLDQMADLFDRDKSVISRHLRKVFQTGELAREAVVAKNATTASDGKTYQVEYYSLDAIISVGYRVNSRRGTQFRIWASKVLKEYLVRGYSVNQRRLAEKGFGEARQVLELLTKTLADHDLVTGEGRAVLDIVSRYAKTWQLLLQYDEENLPMPREKHDSKSELEIGEVRRAIMALKKELLTRGEATDIFGQERGDGLAGIIGAVHQTFGGQDLYPSAEEKAAHLLYFVIKDHPFVDGNKRVGSFLLLLFLDRNGLLSARGLDTMALVSTALLIAASDPGQKELVIRLVVNLLGETGTGDAVREIK